MAQKVLRCGIKKEPGYLYFIDKDGDIARAKMARGGKKKKKTAAKKSNAKKAAKKSSNKKTSKKKK